MTTLLRRSGNLARLSRISPHSNACLFSPYIRQSIKKVSRLGAVQPRLYATGEPRHAENSKDDDPRPKAEAGSLVKNGQKIGRAPKGFDQLYSDGGPLSGTSKGPRSYRLAEREEKKLGEPRHAENSRDDDPRPKAEAGSLIKNGQKIGRAPKGFEQLYSDGGPLSGKSKGPRSSRLTEREEKKLEELVAWARKHMPASQVKFMEAAMKDVKIHGMPQEVREIFDKLQLGAPLNISTALKLFRLTFSWARQSQERVDRAEAKAEGQKSPLVDPPVEESQDDKQSWEQQYQQNQQKSGDSKRSFKVAEVKFDTTNVVLTLFTGYLFYRMFMPSENQKDITWQEFRTTFLDNGLVNKLTVINRSRVRVELHREATGQMYPESPAQHANFFYYFSVGSVEAFERKLDDAQDSLEIPNSERIPVSYVDEYSWFSGLITSLAPTLFLIGGLYWMSRRAGGSSSSGSSIFGIGKSRAKRFNHESAVKTKFKDVAGMDEAKAEIMEFVSFLKSPGQYQRLGAKIPRGAILSGPPGTGKTLLAKATAGESQVPFFSVSGSEFVEMFVGVGPSRVRDLFANARKNTPCIIFIDEIDAIGKARGKGNFSGGNDERESTLNQILTEMDGFNTSEQVVVLAGTNRPDVLDKALLRPGRFDRHIAIDRPTMEGRKQIFLVHLRKIVTDEDMEYLTGRLSALTPGFSGADIANCVNEAALIAARTSADTVVMSHFEQAIERVIGGLEKKSLVLRPEEKRVVAYHEAGHAISGWFFKYADPLLKVSIIPRGQGALGYAQTLPQGDVYLMNVNQLMDRMAMTLAGRVSEELHFETVTSGAEDDFNKVTKMAYAMVTRWGMSSKIGYLYYEESEQNLHKPFSEETARNIDQEVRRIVDKAYQQCRNLLTKKKREVGLVAEELLAKEALGREDMIRILGKRPFEENAEFTQYFDGSGKKSAPPPPPSENEDGPSMPSPVL